MKANSNQIVEQAQRIIRRLKESGLQQPQLLGATSILMDGDILLTWRRGPVTLYAKLKEPQPKS